VAEEGGRGRARDGPALGPQSEQSGEFAEQESGDEDEPYPQQGIDLSIGVLSEQQLQFRLGGARIGLVHGIGRRSEEKTTQHRAAVVVEGLLFIAWFLHSRIDPLEFGNMSFSVKLYERGDCGETVPFSSFTSHL